MCWESFDDCMRTGVPTFVYLTYRLVTNPFLWIFMFGLILI